MACLTPLGVEKLKEMLTTDGSKLSELAKLNTKSRKAKIKKFMGDNTDYVNYEIEKRLVSKTVKPLLNWVEKEVKSPKQRADILKRVARIQSDIQNDNTLELLGNRKSRELYLEDLVEHKLGVSVSTEETAMITELASNADKARTEMTTIANAKTSYGKAYNLMAKGVTEEQALKENGITKKEYDKISEQRVEAGLEIYKYIDYMDALKNDANALKKSDFTKNWWEASKKLGGEVFNSIRNVMASGELGFIFRQGLKTMYKDPKIWLKNSISAVDNAIKGAKNINFKASVMAEIITRPNYLSGHYAEAKLAINTIEDYYKNAWIERITESDKPNFLQDLGQRYTKMSEDTYLAYLFKMRADLFDAHWEKLQEAGADYKTIGEFFNNLTGRGSGMVGEKGSGLMFSAKYTQSQINSFGKILTEKNPAIRMEYIKNLASLLGGTALMLMLASLFGLEAELDPRSTKFMRITFPNGYVMDITGGLTTYAVLMSRLLTKEIKTSKGRVIKMGRFGRPDAQELISNFMFSKGSPQISIAMAMFNRELFGGQEMTPQSFMASIMPIFGQEAYDKMTDDELNALGKLLLTSSAFFGLSSYSPNNFKKQKRK